MSEVLGKFRCSSCRQAFDMTELNVDAFRYGKQPMFNHLLVKCSNCQMPHFVWPDSDLWQRVWLSPVEVRDERTAPSDVTRKYLADHPVLPTHRLTPRLENEVRDFAASLQQLCTETIMGDLQSAPMASLPLYWV